MAGAAAFAPGIKTLPQGGAGVKLSFSAGATGQLLLGKRFPVIPVKAGIQLSLVIPAKAGSSDFVLVFEAGLSRCRASYFSLMAPKKR
jgi:hypothetical protein